MARVLVLDNDQDHRLIIARLLKKWGHEVKTVGNPEEAARMFIPGLQKEKFDVIVSDFDYGKGMNFSHFHQNLRKNKVGVPVIVISSRDRSPLVMPLRNDTPPVLGFVLKDFMAGTDAGEEAKEALKRLIEQAVSQGPARDGDGVSPRGA